MSVADVFVALSLLLSLAAATRSGGGGELPAEPVRELMDWSEYKRVFGKHYSSISEERTRRGIFEQHSTMIAKWNAVNRNRLLLGINQFSDLSRTEFRTQYANPRLVQGWPSPAPQMATDASPGCSMTVANGTNYADGDVVSFSKLPSAGACCRTCSNVSACQFFNFVAATNACTLYANASNARATVDAADACGSQGGPPPMPPPMPFPPSPPGPSEQCGLFVTKDSNYADGEVVGFSSGINSSNLCCEKCANASGCSFFNYKATASSCSLYSTASSLKKTDTGDACGSMDDPDSIDWIKKGAVTPIKNQGQCGACWAFAAVAAIESRFQISTGELRVLSEQQLMDCSNQGACLGGMVHSGFIYVKMNGGLDSEAEYNYTAKRGPCWKAAEKRDVATIDGYTMVKPKSEAELAAALAKNPVAVTIDGASDFFQHYKSGVIDASSGCGATPSHGAVVVGMTKDYWVLRNSWGTVWGENGYARLARNAGGPEGVCGITIQPTYPTRAPAPAPVFPPPTPGPRPGSIPKSHYENPANGCQPDEIAAHVPGLTGSICSPSCPSTTPPPYNSTCPTDTPPGTTAKPYCILAMAGGKYYCALKCGDNTESMTSLDRREEANFNHKVGENNVSMSVRQGLQLPPPTPLGLTCPKGATCKATGKYKLCTYP